MTGHELQYIASTNGSFNCVLAANVSHNSVIEEKFLATSYVQDAVYFGENYADIRFSNENKLMYWYAGGNIDVTSLYTYNVEHVVSFSTYEYYFDGVKVYDVTGVCNIPSQPRFRSNVKGYLCYFKITDNNVDRVNLVAWEDGNGTLGMYDKVNDVFYTPATGTWTAGPVVHVFESDKSSLRFEASGGTGTLEITAETGWTCTTPTAFTMSTTTGTTGTTTITVTAPANTGSTKIEETITFTDADNYTFDVKLRQKVEGVGFSYLQIGADTIDTFYIGDLQIEALYFGEEQIYGSGPFVGLKATKTLSFNPNQLTGTLKIKSSENWSLTDNSTVGSYYTLENYTNGCNGWVPTYDGSLDGGELNENGLWFEWEYGVSDKPFQEWVDGLAEYGITATGSYCSGARYSIYLNPHQTGGPGWLSYSQTTGGTGDTIVTVTANTYSMSEAKTATITISSANYTATTNVNLNFYIMPANEVWYKTTNNNSINSFRSGSYYIGSTGQRLTYTQSFDSESGLWKMVFNDDVYGNYESLYYNNDNRLVELWLPRYFNHPHGIFVYGQTHFEKFKGDSPSIVDNGNMVIDLVQSSQTYNWVVQGAKANVTDIVVPNGVTTIQGYCFYCTTASTLTIPASVTIVDVYSLERTVINRIDCLGTTAPTFYSQTFYAVSNNGTLHYPAGADYSSVYVPSTWTKVGDL